jgi:hypothetical protein
LKPSQSLCVPFRKQFHGIGSDFFIISSQSHVCTSSAAPPRVVDLRTRIDSSCQCVAASLMQQTSTFRFRQVRQIRCNQVIEHLVASCILFLQPELVTWMRYKSPLLPLTNQNPSFPLRIPFAAHSCSGLRRFDVCASSCEAAVNSVSVQVCSATTLRHDTESMPRRDLRLTVIAKPVAWLSFQ